MTCQGNLGTIEVKVEIKGHRSKSCRHFQGDRPKCFGQKTLPGTYDLYNVMTS